MPNISDRRKVFAFLKDLKRHNDRVWFKAHRDRYEEANGIFMKMVEEFIKGLGTFDEEVAHVEPKQTVYRIYRDTRFSPDKSPYKTHLGTFVNARGAKTPYLGYYLHIEPGACMIACGNYWTPSDALAAIRNDIVANPDRLLRIVRTESFQQTFGQEVGFDCLKTVPKGFPKDFPHPELLRPRAYGVSTALNDSDLRSNDWLTHVLEICKQGKPFMDYINETIADYL